MPSKTKNRRAKGTRRHRKGTRGQRGGDWMHTLSFGLTGTADDLTTPKQTWSEWAGITSDPSGKSWWERITSSSPTTNPMQSNNAPSSPLSNSDFPTDATSPYGAQYSGGKKSKSKSRSCHHKHTKSCSK